MSDTPRDEPVTLACIHCGDEQEALTSVLAANRQLICHACGVTLEYDPRPYRARLAASPDADPR